MQYNTVSVLIIEFSAVQYAKSTDWTIQYSILQYLSEVIKQYSTLQYNTVEYCKCCNWTIPCSFNNSVKYNTLSSAIKKIQQNTIH